MENTETNYWCKNMRSFSERQRNINRLVMNYLVREAYKETAQRFVIEADIGKHPQLDSIEDRLLIRNAIRAGSIQYAVEVAKKLYLKLFETDNYMYFHMQQMQLMELIRERQVDQSIILDQQKHSKDQSNRLECIYESDRTLALLAYENLDKTRYSEQMQRIGRQNKTITKDMQQENEELFPGLENCEPKMMFLIKLILWAQNRLEEGGGYVDFEKLELEGEQFEQLLRRAMQEEE